MGSLAELLATVSAPTFIAIYSFVVKAFTRAVKREREELNAELLPLGDAELDGGTPSEKESAKYTKLLIRYYSYGLTQAKASFFVSLGASIIGGVVLIIGVVLAISHADSGGKQYASIVTSVSGLLTAAVGALFHKRADSALNHMESQTGSLRQDLKAQRDLDEAVELLGQEEDSSVKSRLRAALILKLSASELPEIGGIPKADSSLPQPRPNGGVTQPHSDSTVS